MWPNKVKVTLCTFLNHPQRRRNLRPISTKTIVMGYYSTFSSLYCAQFLHEFTLIFLNFLHRQACKSFLRVLLIFDSYGKLC